ncbi:Nucleic acid-binding, OB-fold containing protein [Trema orientale]|uniref:Nucleic acid-binding, OB-fold containing protein n=1 Tax=Trema orientale TaxID=63057 RepID=A0A2P5FDH9_TREOI|nr:Nucleic acid-binding, OB-fold containing protein [Trema orientale]
MGSSSQRKRIAFRRNFHLLRALSISKSHAKRRSVVMDAFFYIYLLKLKLEGIKREYSNLVAIKEEYLKMMNHIHNPNKEVKVEKTEEGFMNVRVRCEKGEDTLVSVLETFEEMALQVLQARVSCTNDSFSLEATTAFVSEDPNQAQLDVRDVTRAITNAIEKK